MIRISAVLGSACIVLAVLALTFDLRLLTFRSGSMAPTIRTGALALARSVPASDLEVGDVVSVRTGTGSRVTHRVVALRHDAGIATLELRGDANEVDDAQPYVVSRADRVWFSVPYLGYAGAAIASPLGLVGLGLYAAFLLRIVFRRPRTPRPRGGRRRAVVTTAAALAVGLAASGTVAARSTPTLAAWTDGVATSGSVVSTGSIAAPTDFSCGAVGVLSVTGTWTAVPGATSYTVHYGAGGSETFTTTSTSATLITVIAGGTAWVTANRNFGSTTWTSAPSNTRTYTVAVLSVCS